MPFRLHLPLSATNEMRCKRKRIASSSHWLRVVSMLVLSQKQQQQQQQQQQRASFAESNLLEHQHRVHVLEKRALVLAALDQKTLTDILIIREYTNRLCPFFLR